MKKFNKSSIITALIISCTLGFMGPITALAQTTPSLGTATTFGVLGSTYTNTAPGTTINGDLGYTSGPAIAPTVSGTTHAADATYNQAGINQGAALTNLSSQACTFTFAPGAIDLAADITHGPIGIYTPGVYCTSGAASIGTGGITLSGSGTYIFEVNGALTTVANSVVTLAGGASACDVFWAPTAATTLGANSTFVGTNIDASGITIGSTVTQTGSSLAFGGTVTTNADTITVPTCSVSPLPLPPPAPVPTCTLSANPTAVQNGSSSALSWTTTNANTFSINQGVGVVSSLASGSTFVTPFATATYTGTATRTGASSAICSATVTIIAPTLATLHVIKQVVNNGGGTAIASNFILHVENSGADVQGSPAAGTATPGTSYSLSAGTYVVSENVSTSYMQSFSGACNSSGSVTLFASDNKTCTITNAYIPPVLTPTLAPVIPTSTPSSTFTPVLTFPNTGFPPEGDSPSWNIVTVVSNILRWLRFPSF